MDCDQITTEDIQAAYGKLLEKFVGLENLSTLVFLYSLTLHKQLVGTLIH